MPLLTGAAEVELHEGAEDVVVFAGGIIPEQDIPKLKEMGIREIFLPGTPTTTAVEAIRNAVAH